MSSSSAFDAVQRQIVIREIYEKSGGKAYKDLRRLCKPKTMQKRLHIIDVLLQVSAVVPVTIPDIDNAPPPGNEAPPRLDRQKLETEKLLLTKKYEIYTKSPNVPMAGSRPREFLKLSDIKPEDEKESKSESARRKKAHTIVLMHYAYIDYSYEELVALRNDVPI